VAGLYLLWLAAFTMPVVIACFLSASDLKKPLERMPWELYEQWPYWVMMGVLCLSQFLFLRVPVRLATRRPVSRRSLWLPVVVAGFWFGLLVIGGGTALAEVTKADAAERSGNLLRHVLVTGVISWIAWSLVFIWISRRTDPAQGIEQQRRWLLRGSILELLIAVPSHIVVRSRGECCAGFLTFVGITMGLTVMLLSFGPAVFFLYHARWRRLKCGG
jgi:hypothetical protein